MAGGSVAGLLLLESRDDIPADLRCHRAPVTKGAPFEEQVTGVPPQVKTSPRCAETRVLDRDGVE
jgi:hypothetical protein